MKKAILSVILAIVTCFFGFVAIGSQLTEVVVQPEHYEEVVPEAPDGEEDKNEASTCFSRREAVSDTYSVAPCSDDSVGDTNDNSGDTPNQEEVTDDETTEGSDNENSETPVEPAPVDPEPEAPVCEHVFGEWVEEVPATCTAEGALAHKDCTICNKHFDAEGNELESIVIDKLGHNYDYKLKEGSEDVYQYVCTREGCGDTDGKDYTKVADKNFVDVIFGCIPVVGTFYAAHTMIINAVAVALFALFAFILGLVIARKFKKRVKDDTPRAPRVRKSRKHKNRDVPAFNPNHDEDSSRGPRIRW